MVGAGGGARKTNDLPQPHCRNDFQMCACVCVRVLPGRRLGRGCFGMCQVFGRTARSGWQEKGGKDREEGCFSFAVPFRHRAGVIGSGHEWDRLCGRVLLMGRSDA